MCQTNKAFTFIEVLVALIVFSLISVCLYSSFHTVLMLRDRSAQVNKSFREARWTMDQLGQDLENMTFYDFSGSYNDKAAFTGAPAKVVFVIHTPDGLKVVAYYLKDTKSRRFLCRDQYDLYDFLQSDIRDLEKVTDHEIVFSDAVSHLQFYYAQRGEDGWLHSWEKAKDVPGAVRVQLILRQGPSSKQTEALQRTFFIPLWSH